MSETHVCLELFLDWLNRTHERRFQIETRTEAGATARDGAISLAVEARPLLGPTENREWLAARDALQEQIAAGLPVAIALWLPAGAGLPAGEPLTSEFTSLVRQTAVRLGPRERSHVPLPVSLFLHKASDAGGVVSVTGALNPYWARFTEHVRGTYDLDSTRLHRLPESDEHLQQLIQTIIDQAAQLDAGRSAEIQTIDAWTVQRRRGRQGVTIIGVPPGEIDDMGLTVRRNLRRLLASSGPSLRGREADPSTSSTGGPTSGGGSGQALRALALLGYYPRIEQEGATTAMRGYDPVLYSGLDFVCLVADGLVKPLIEAPTGVLQRRRG